MEQSGAGSAKAAVGRGGWSAEFIGSVRHLGGGLLHSRLLLAYCVLGLLWGLPRGAMGFGAVLFNYLVLLPLYVLIIYLWTRGRPTLAQVAADDAPTGRGAARRRDLALVVVLYAVNIAGVVWFWVAGPPQAVIEPVAAALRQAGWDRELANTTINALGSVLLSLIPALVVVFGLFRLSPGQVGLRPRNLGLGVALIVLGVGLALLIKLVFGNSTKLVSAPEAVPLALAIFCAQLFINGLPEEFIFRGAILSRLLPWLRNPHHALVLVSGLFVASHYPSYLARPTGAPWWTLVPLSPGSQPTGLEPIRKP
mgnify:CR=1 FL=1